MLGTEEPGGGRLAPWRAPSFGKALSDLAIIESRILRMRSGPSGSHASHQEGDPVHDPDRLQGRSVAIIGGCGHIGLPLGVKLALAGASTRLIDVNQLAVDQVN